MQEVNTFPITHIGLFTTEDKKIKELSDRVVKFNMRHGSLDVKMTARWVAEPSPHCNQPHYDILMEYTSKEVADKFWTE